MIHEHHHLFTNILHAIAGGALGLFAAATANAFGWRSADRMPGESRWPACLYCLRAFTWQECFPLFGWLLRPDVLHLTCPCGLRKGQWQQPVAEIIGFILGVIAMILSGWSMMTIPLCLGLGTLVAIAMIDLHFGIIPDGLNALIAVLGIWWALSGGTDIYMSLMVAAAMLALGLFCALGYSKWRGREMLGLGDVKFFAASGLWLLPEQAPWFLAIAGGVGAIVGIAWKRISGNEESPFGPALCFSLAICVLYQLVEMS